jgi:hypothetical protein
MQTGGDGAAQPAHEQAGQTAAINNTRGCPYIVVDYIEVLRQEIKGSAGYGHRAQGRADAR